MEERLPTPPLQNFNPIISKKQVSLIAPGVSADVPASVSLYSLCYQFEVIFKRSDAEFRWLITRSYSEFKDLTRDLSREAWHKVMPRAPTLPSAKELRRQDAQVQLEMLENYLVILTRDRPFCMSRSFRAFIEVSIQSFAGLEVKFKEGYVAKRTGGRAVNEKRCLECMKYFKRFQHRWLMVRPNGIGYMTHNDSEHWHEALMFKNKFNISSGFEATGYEDGIKIDTSTRLFVFKAGSAARRIEWVEAIQDAYENSEWNAKKNLNGSSFPVRGFNQVKSFVDGEAYFEAVHTALLEAKHHVFITSWWVSPEMFLLRPAKQHPDSQVIKVLATVAARGVKVYVHVYKEVAFVSPMNSLHTIMSLRAVHVKAIRHPHRTISGGKFLWAHHEKLVVVDYETAFLGGLDLCFGRYDTNAHGLVDLGPEPFWNGIDYSNSRIADFEDVIDWDRDSIDRSTLPRMPWHDVAIQVKGKAAADVALHFIELWNHVMSDTAAGYYKSKQVLHLPVHHQPHMQDLGLISKPPEERKNEGDDDGDSDRRGHDGILPLMSIPLGLANQPGGMRSPSTPHSLTEGHTKIDVKRLISRLPMASKQSHYIPISETDQSIQALAKEAKVNRLLLRLREPVVNVLHEVVRRGLSAAIKSKRPVESQEDSGDELKDMREAIKNKDDEILTNRFVSMFTDQRQERQGECSCQLLRSGSVWSIGLEETDSSIHTAYLNMISEAQHFIYIENQFFISGTAGDPVENQIAQALVDRILVAAAEQTPFRVVVVMPLLPGFEGAVDDPSASVLRIQLHWEYATICRGENSVFSQLKANGIEDPGSYIRFYGLRTHCLLNDVPQTEIVYVHSKLMIVDDSTVIMGSANINDRSMLGFNDSEIAMRIHDPQVKRSVMAGREFQASLFAYDLRMRLFKELSGCTDESKLQDPFSEAFREEWDDVAEVRPTQRNTVIYRNIFNCYPDDSFTKFTKLPDAIPSLSLYEPYSQYIQGFLVEFPLNFLCKEDLRISVFHKEYLGPEVGFV
jgi:phospholipase D1/2